MEIIDELVSFSKYRVKVCRVRRCVDLPLTGNKEVHREWQSGEGEAMHKWISGEQHIVILPGKDNESVHIFLNNANDC